MMSHSRSSRRGAGLMLGVALALGACAPDDTPTGQVVARVNGDEISIHQLEFAQTLQQAGAATAGSREALVDKLVDRQLAVQAALAGKLDRRMEVMMRVEEARRDILAAAYAEQVASGLDEPSREEAARYYEEHPGLFSRRKIYRLREVSLPVGSAALPEVRERMARKEDLESVLTWLRTRSEPFTDQRVLRPAERLPVEIADQLVQVGKGQTITFDRPAGLVIYTLEESEPAPISWQDAKASIQAFLKNQAAQRAVADALKRLRAEAELSANTGLTAQ